MIGIKEDYYNEKGIDWKADHYHFHDKEFNDIGKFMYMKSETGHVLPVFVPDEAGFSMTTIDELEEWFKQLLKGDWNE